MTQATWGNIHTRIVTILNEIGEFTRVYATVPRTLNDADLPAVVVIPQQNTRARGSGDSVKDTRTYDLQVFLSNTRSGIGGEREGDAYTLNIWDAVYLEFDGRRRLAYNDSGLVTEATITQDTGLQQLVYPPNSDNIYYGVVFTLVLERIWRVEQRR